MRHQLPSKPIRRAVRRIAAAMCCLFALSAVAQQALGTVTVEREVLQYPTRPASPGEFYADKIPVNGNILESGVDVGQQIDFEGWAYNNNTPGDLTDDYNVNFHIVVGWAHDGYMEIGDGTDLRDMDLWIGDSGTIRGEVLQGSGTVVIHGLYNNDPYIIPWYPGIDVTDPISPSVNPRYNDPDADDGFDLYVGRTGFGTLDISQGGVAEIQDAVSVGDMGSSVGTLTVDGVGSLLSSGGFQAGVTTDPNVIHYFDVGRRGTGTVYILNGGQIDTRGPTSSIGTQTTVTAAVIGGNEYDGHAPPEAGGNGTVLIDGLGSEWNLVGNLQVGGFHDAVQGEVRNLAGDRVQYASNVGNGTLTISNGGLVNIVPTPVTGTTTSLQELLMVIGRKGTVNLATGGRVVIQTGFQNTGGTTPIPLVDNVGVINDGVIQGSGRIDTGTFDNRYYGRIHVGAGESLEVNATTANIAANQPLPFANYGLIEVIGTEEARAELDFTWQSATNTDPTEVPFVNRPVATTLETAPTTFDGGMISAQWATLRFSSGNFEDRQTPDVFPSGMRNEGVMAFTAGTNIIQGEVLNAQDPNADPGNPPLIPKFIVGPDTTVVVEDDFSVAPPAVLDLGAGAHLLILDQSTLALAGTVNMDLGASGEGPMTVVGDVGVGGHLNVSLSNDLLLSLTHGSTFELLSFSGTAYHIDTSDPNYYFKFAGPLLPGAQGFESVTTNADLLYPELDALVRLIGNGLYLSFLNPTLIGAVGADFNGDGIVDLADLAIWRANFGITAGASILQGDVDGDGDVDGHDFLLLQQQFGGPPVPVPGGGAGSGLAIAVPEPTSGMLLLCGVVLALTAARRRSPSATGPGERNAS